MTQTTAFIGAGNMAAALIGGLIADGVDPGTLVASDPSDTARRALAESTGIRTSDDNGATVAAAHTVVLAVKPQVLKDVARAIAPHLQHGRQLVISIAAGIRTADLRAWLGDATPLVRTMPNTPALVQAGATVLFAGPGVSDAQRTRAESLMRAVGLTQWVDDEDLMDTVTALSGSGPAYFFLIMEALEAAAVDLGLNVDTARLLTLQTALGAARMALESSEPPATLRARVTSPGGTTERAIASLEHDALRDILARALGAARARSRQLSAELGEN